MKLIFTDFGGETRTLRAVPSATVADLRQHVALLLDISSSQMKLSVRTGCLDDDQKTLRDYGLTSGFTVVLTANFPVTVRNLKGQCKTYSVTTDATVHQLMEKISHKEETPADQIGLTHDSQALIPGRKLTDYNIGIRSMISMNRQRKD